MSPGAIFMAVFFFYFVNLASKFFDLCVCRKPAYVIFDYKSIIERFFLELVRVFAATGDFLFGRLKFLKDGGLWLKPQRHKTLHHSA